MNILKSAPLLFILCSCATTSITRINSLEKAKPMDCKIDVYKSVEEVKRKYIVTCEIKSKTGGTLFDNRTIDGAIKHAKRSACKCGGDAIYVEQSEEKGINPFSWGKTAAKIVAIKYQD